MADFNGKRGHEFKQVPELLTQNVARNKSYSYI